MAEEGNKQAVIASNEGINQEQWMDDPELGAPSLPPKRPAFSLKEQARLSDPSGDYYRSPQSLIAEPIHRPTSEF